MMYSEAIQFLNLNYPVTQDSIKKAYRRLAKDYHPDAGGNAEQFKKLTWAYEVALQGPVYQETFTASDNSDTRDYNNYNTRNYNNTYSSQSYEPFFSYIIYLAVAGIILGALMIFDMYFDLRFMAQNVLNSISYLHIVIALIVGFVVISIYHNPAKLLLYGVLIIFAVIAWQELAPYYWQITDIFSQFNTAINQINYIL